MVKACRDLGQTYLVAEISCSSWIELGTAIERVAYQFVVLARGLQTLLTKITGDSRVHALRAERDVLTA
ncbi:hypothetical protein GUJ93_ZPchr0014g46718 [Zizania palustris]|uniref:Uncharacterized protein n=1 Tax=Zizania palustris TaxID=103762 RepID=A0A8J5T9Z5_ZIZPA|nr:hypothetical protein GUJ93_ZPchr0014g46718 [Zizania palustris]